MRGNALISDRRVRGEHGRVFSLVSENNINRSIVKILIAEGEDGVWAGTAPFPVWGHIRQRSSVLVRFRVREYLKRAGSVLY